MKTLFLNFISYIKCRIKRFGKAHGLRYSQLYELIRYQKPINILEIGVFDGENAVRMLNINPELKNKYWGIDLFEDLSPKNYKKEIAIHPLSKAGIEKKLKEKTNAEVQLIKGDTTEIKEVLLSQLPKMDLIFVDGGHSVETQRNDWNIARSLINKDGVIIIDDCWNLPNSGCSFLLDEIDKSKYNVRLLPKTDLYLKEWGFLITQFLKITTK